MSSKLLAPLTGIALSLFCSASGTLIATSLGGDPVSAATLVQMAAATVLLVMILSRLETKS